MDAPDPSGEQRKKRLVFCFDGTWNRLSTDKPTNVVLLAQMIEPVAKDGTSQIVYYDEGIGTSAYYLKRVWQGMIGGGMKRIMREAYRFLIFNYSPGDEIFVFGFSRGAFTARSFAGFIRHAGILDAASASNIGEAIRLYEEAPAGVTGVESLDALEFRSEHCSAVCVSEDDYAYRRMTVRDFDESTPILNIRYLGVWDTVRALGVPDFLPFSAYFNRKYGFHDAVLTSKVQSARHAVALDERRLTFPPTMLGSEKVQELNTKAEKGFDTPLQDWQMPYQEQWFPGVHGSIGGGGKERGLSDTALHWVLTGARRAGLDVRSQPGSLVFFVRPDPFCRIFNDPPGWMKRAQSWFHRRFGLSRRGPDCADAISLAAYRRFHELTEGKHGYRPRALDGVETDLFDWDYHKPLSWKSPDGVPYEDHELGEEDTLSELADERLGDAQLWNHLFAVNRDRIDDPDYLPTGTKIRLPIVSPASPPPKTM